jgi:hypothetical protein
MKAKLRMLDDKHIELAVEAENDVETIALEAWSERYWHDPALTTASLVVRRFVAPGGDE